MAKKVKSVAHLKRLSTNKHGRRQSFYLAIIEGIVRSVKQILYNPKTERFIVVNENDYSMLEDLTEQDLKEKTHIVDAIEMGTFYKY
jgi:hypothetical protein